MQRDDSLDKAGLGRDTQVAERREMAKKFAQRRAESRARFLVRLERLFTLLLTEITFFVLPLASYR